MVSSNNIYTKIPDSLYKYLQSYPGIREEQDSWTGPCPLHKGDNPTAFRLYKNTNIWRCFTRQCHEDHGQTARSLCKALNIDPGNPEFSVDPFGASSRKLKREQKAICSREEFTKRLCEIPSKYALSRGFSNYILRKYCVGTSYKKGPMAYRCVCPIFSDDYKHIVGMSGRDITDKKPDYKWVHHGFKAAHNLYNLWFAKSSIRNTKTVILVEGVFDVLALVQAKVPNVVATMGLGIKPVQETILQKLGVQNIVFGYDNDEAARIAIEHAEKKHDLCYNFNTLRPPKKDWAESSTREIEEYFVQNEKLLP